MQFVSVEWMTVYTELLGSTDRKYCNFVPKLDFSGSVENVN